MLKDQSVAIAKSLVPKNTNALNQLGIQQIGAIEGVKGNLKLWANSDGQCEVGNPVHHTSCNGSHRMQNHEVAGGAQLVANSIGEEQAKGDSSGSQPKYGGLIMAQLEEMYVFLKARVNQEAMTGEFQYNSQSLYNSKSYQEPLLLLVLVMKQW